MFCLLQYAYDSVHTSKDHKSLSDAGCQQKISGLNVPVHVLVGRPSANGDQELHKSVLYMLWSGLLKPIQLGQACILHSRGGTQLLSTCSN